VARDGNPFHREVSMTIDFGKEKPISLADAAKRLPSLRSGKSVNPSTVCRWIMTGIARPDGTRLRLEALRVGVSWITSHEAVDRYLSALTAACLPADAAETATPRTAKRRKRASVVADETLAGSGW
jgi:hypothetical protein